MYTFKKYTIETLYCKNSMSLFSELLLIAKHFKNDRLFITYGNNAEVDLSKVKQSVVINIQRHNKEYKGFINRYIQLAIG